MLSVQDFDVSQIRESGDFERIIIKGGYEIIHIYLGNTMIGDKKIEKIIQLNLSAN